MARKKKPKKKVPRTTLEVIEEEVFEESKDSAESYRREDTVMSVESAPVQVTVHEGLNLPGLPGAMRREVKAINIRTHANIDE